MSEEELYAAKNLPYKRVLSDEEIAELTVSLSSKWCVPAGYWYPLAEKSHEHIEAYQDRHFLENFPAEKLHQILRSHNISRVFELREYGPCYELDCELFDPSYNGAEGYWVSSNLDWIIYASHESSITIGGWLLEEVKKVWPNHSSHVWRTPFFD